MSSLRAVLLRSSLVFALCLGATACGPSQQEAQIANVKPGSMPEGGDWAGVYYSQLYGYLHILADGRAANGAWRTTAGDAYGEMSGEIDGDLFRYSWTERRIGAVGADANRKGKGYFRYTAPKAGEAHVITGEWGLGDSDAGNPWEAVKQKNMPPNPDSVRPDEIEGRVTGAGGWDEGEGTEGGDKGGDSGGDTKPPTDGPNGDPLEK
jgi:hypothetical protein